MSKPSTQTAPNISKAPHSAIPAQSTSSQNSSRVSSWSKGPPAFANSPISPNPAIANANAPPAAAAARSSSTGVNGSSARQGSHSRKPSTLGPGAPVKDSVTMPRNAPAAAPTVQSLNFGSISDSTATLSSSPANAPSLSQHMDVQSFGSIRAEPAPTPAAGTSAPAKSAPSDAKQTPTPPPSVPATPASKLKRKVDVNALFQQASSSAPPPAPASAIPSPGPSSTSFRNGTASPTMSPRQRTTTLPNGGFQGMGSPSMNSRALPGGNGPRSPQLHRAQINGGPNGSRNGPQVPNGAPPPQQQQNNGAPMNSPRMAPGQLPQSPVMYYGYGPGQMPQRMDPNVYSPYGYYPSPSDPYNPGWAYAQPPMIQPGMQPGMPPPPPPQQQPQPQQQQQQQLQQGPPPPHLGPHAPGPHPPTPMTPSSRNVHLPPPPQTPNMQPQTILPTPSTPTMSSARIVSSTLPSSHSHSHAPTLSRSAPAFQPRAANRSSAITIKTPDGAVISSPSRPVSIITPSSSSSAPLHAPSHTRAVSISSPKPPVSSLAASDSTGEVKPPVRAPVRLEKPEDRDKRVKAAEAEAKAKKDAEEAAAKAKADAEAKAKAEAEAAAKAEEARIQAEKEEAERKAAEEAAAELARIAKEKEEAEAKEAERLRLEAEAEEKRLKEKEAEEARAKAEAEEKAAAAAKAADAAREADVLAAATKAEADRIEAEQSARQAEEAEIVKPTAVPLSLGGKRPQIGLRLDLSNTNAKNIVAAPMSALASARIIDDLAKTPYPEGIKSPAPELNVNSKEGKFRYDRDFLVQFMKVCVEKPDALPDLDALGISNNGDMPARPVRQRTASSMGPPSRAASIAGGAFQGAKSSFGGGAMGSFTSANAKGSSSADRFAASNAGMGRSVSGAAAMGRGGPIPMSRSSSQGGVGMIPQSPRGEHATTRTRSSRGGRRSDKPNGGGGGGGGGHSYNSPSMSNISLEPVAPLEISKDRWIPDSVVAPSKSSNANDPANVSDPAIVERKVKAILNKLTMEKFDKLSDQVIDWANKSENETDGATLILVIKLIFEKATDEAAWSEMYARLCRKMMEKISPKVEDKSVKNSAGQPIQGGQLFRKYLLNRCQEDFQNGWATRTKTAAAAADKAQDDEAKTAANEGKGEGETVLYSEEYYAAEKAKRRGLGLVKFIGELFKLQMLTERIMHECIKQLLANIENPEEEDIESLCRLLITVGQTMDTERARDHMNVYFTRMTEILKNPAITSRVKFMIQDVIELRNRKWQARSAIATPSTIAQVHAQADRDAAYSRNQGPPMSRGGSRRGGAREETTQDGWNVAGPSVTRVPTNLSNFGKLSKAATQSAPSDLFGVYAKKGGKTRDAPPTLSRAQSNANMFSALNSEAPADLPPTTPSSRAPSRKASLDLGAGGVPDAAGGRKKLVLAPRTVAADTAEETVSEQPEPEEAEVLATDSSVMSAEKAQTKIKEDIKEFWNVRNLDDAQHYFSALPTEHRHLLVAQFASSALDKKEDDVKLVAEVFSKAAGELCSEEAFEAGLLTVVEIVDDLSVDVPKAYAFVARLLHGSKLPKAKVEELSTKIIVDGDPLTPPPAKLLKEYEKLQ